MAVVNPFGSEIKNPFKTKEEEEEKVVNPFKDKEVTIFGNTFNIDTGENIPEVKKIWVEICEVLSCLGIGEIRNMPSRLNLMIN